MWSSPSSSRWRWALGALAYWFEFNSLVYSLPFRVEDDRLAAGLSTGLAVLVGLLVTASLAVQQSRIRLEQADTAFDRPNLHTEDWDYWCGSPELLAHLARVALRAASAAGYTATCTIDVEVAGDHEIFDGPDAFLAGVTKEALHGFRVIDISVAGADLLVTVRLAWRRRSNAGPPERDADAILTVSSDREEVSAQVFAACRPAVVRGTRYRHVLQSETLIGVAFGLAVAVSVGSALYLLGQPFEGVLVTGAVIGGVGILVGVLWGAWLSPSLEIAAFHQTRLWRTIRIVGPITGALVVSGIGKALFG